MPPHTFLYALPVSGAIRCNVRQSHAKYNNVKVNALSWQANVNHTARENTILTTPEHRIPSPLNFPAAGYSPFTPNRYE